jgi:excisionase family DNA binding protein
MAVLNSLSNEIGFSTGFSNNPRYADCGYWFENGSRRFYLEQLISVSEAARRLGGISKWTVHAWLSQGRLQRTKVGSRTMIRESELQKMIEDGGKSHAPRRTGEAV